MLWLFERFDIGRPQLFSYEPYEYNFYTLDEFGVPDPMDGPTMGSIWCRRQVCTSCTKYVNVFNCFITGGSSDVLMAR